MDINGIEDIQEVGDIGCDGGGRPPQVKPKCVAQVSPEAKEVDVKPSDCCNNIIARVSQNLDVETREIRASIIKGKVTCNGGSTGVKGAIVVATEKGKTAPSYVGITNSKGEYSICVPTPRSISNTTYSVEAYCASGCVGDNLCPKTDSCDCGCK